MAICDKNAQILEIRLTTFNFNWYQTSNSARTHIGVLLRAVDLPSIRKISVSLEIGSLQETELLWDSRPRIKKMQTLNEDLCCEW